MSGRRIYVNGAGVVSAAGTSIGCVKNYVSSGILHHGAAKRFETSLGLTVAEVSASDAELKSQLGIASEIVISRTALLGLCALSEAVKSVKSGHLFGGGPRIAFINGTSVGGMDLSEVFWRAHRQDPENGDLDYLRMHSPGAVTDAMAAFCRSLLPDFSFVTTISTACSAAGNAIMYGARLIEAGLADIVIAGGTDALCSFTLNGFNSLRILDTEICRPFDASRAGLNLGEGAGYLVLSAVSDGAMCRLSGWGNANEAYHQTASTPEGTGPGLSMSSAIEKAGLTPSDIGFVNTHGTGTEINDLAESNAMLRVFGGQVPPFSSMKPYFGHTLGASEGIEAALCCKALADNDFSFMKSWREVTPISETGLVPYYGGEISPRHVLSSAFGFSGNCVSLVFSTISEDE